MSLWAALAVTGVAGLIGYYKSPIRRRRRLRSRPFPAEWEAILQKNVALYRKLPEDLRTQLRSHILVFLGEKDFEGCGGLVITDEIRVTIASQACLLLLNRPARYFPGLKAILVYPRAYVQRARRQEGYIHFEDERQVNLGESWSNGTLVLSWNDVANTAHDVRDGHNLVLHEFAHQLDTEDGVGDGVPILEQQSRYYHWAEVLDKEYRNLVTLTRKHKKDVLQAYGATNPAEFFAVATEAFFERPVLLNRKHPELYQELRDFYRLDPEKWLAPV
ncbi:MAG: M90 family metallopeptidase [Vulcanimicrobiota bacterium]